MSVVLCIRKSREVKRSFSDGTTREMSKTESERHTDANGRSFEVGWLGDRPVRSSSGGTYKGLAVVVATGLNPETPLIHGVVAVGDTQMNGKPGGAPVGFQNLSPEHARRETPRTRLRGDRTRAL